MLLCVCFTCSSKGHASWLWLVVFDPQFFAADKPLPMVWTSTVVNFHNLHSLLGQFGSLIFEQTESSDYCWFVEKNSFLKRDTKGILKISHRRKGHPCSGLYITVSFAVSSRIRLVAKHETFQKFSLVFTVSLERLWHRMLRYWYKNFEWYFQKRIQNIKSYYMTR